MDYILILVGFLLLVKGADIFVEGSSSIAKTLRIPTLVIGLTIVAFGTSAPELAVSVTAALQGSNDISVGNVVGSNIFNLLAVVGAAAVIYPLRVKKSIIKGEMPIMIFVSALLMLLSFDFILNPDNINELSRFDGFILLGVFALFFVYLFKVTMKSDENTVSEEEIEVMSLPKSIIYSIIGVAGIIIGGKFVVDSATSIALVWGMSEKLVGLTIVSLGTSLPEFVTSVIAAKKGESDIALGNVIGSNIFNILLILGVSSTITPIAINGAVFFDMSVMIIVTVLTYIFAISRRQISKLEGTSLLLVYIAYFVYIIIRN